MDGKKALAVLAACAGLTACAATDAILAEIIDIEPTAGELDSTLPFGTTNGVEVSVLSADDGGVWDSRAKITFFNDGSFTIVLRDGGPEVTVTEDDLLDPRVANAELGTTDASYSTADGYDVDVYLGEDDPGNDLFFLARVEEDPFNAALGTLGFVVVGDETATAALPSGNGIAYVGGFVSEVYDAAGNSVVQYSGDTAITANFTDGNVDMIFTETGEATGIEFQATGIDIVGAGYEGDFTSSGGGTNFVGRVIGSFYGPGAEATAGTFNAVDPGALPLATTDDTTIIGGFTGFQ